MGPILNMCNTLISIYAANVNGNDLTRLGLYSEYFRVFSQHNNRVRATNFINDNFLVKAYLNPMDHRLLLGLYDSQNRRIPNGAFDSNPGLRVNSENLIHVFGVHEGPLDQGDTPAHQIIISLAQWNYYDDMYNIFECSRILLFGC